MLFIHSYIIKRELFIRKDIVRFLSVPFLCCVAFYFVYSLFSLPLFFCNHKYILATNENFLRFSNLVSIPNKMVFGIYQVYRQLYICICQVCTFKSILFLKFYLITTKYNFVVVVVAWYHVRMFVLQLLIQSAKY